MMEAEPNYKLLKQFLATLRREDKEETQALGCQNFEYDLFDYLDNKPEYTYFLLSKNKKPLALGGAKETGIPYVAKVWLLTTNELKNNKLELYKYVKNKIELFKTKYDVLYNFIYKTNFNSLKWLKKAGFSELSLENRDYKLFYFIHGGKEFDIRYFTCE